MFSNSIISNLAGSLLGLSVSKGLRFFGIAYCIRMVGDYGWGQIASTLAAFAFLTFLIDQGISGSALLFRIGDRRSDRRLLVLISSYRLVMALLFIAVINAVHFYLIPVDPLFRAYSLALIPRALGLDWWFQRRQLYQMTLFTASARTLAFFGMALLLVSPGTAALTVIWIEVAAECVGLLLGFFAMIRARRTSELPPSEHFGLRELLVYSMPFLLIGVLNTIHGSADILILRAMLGATSVAEYDIGTKVGFLYFFLGGAVIQIIRPKLSMLYLSGNLTTMGRVLKVSASLLLLLSTLFFIPSLYFPEQIISILFGERHGVTISTFRWVALWVGTSFSTMLCADTLLSLGRRRDYFRGAVACAAINVIANVVLLRLFAGYGAIFAKISAEAVFLVVTYNFLPMNVRAELRGAVVTHVLVLTGISTVYLITRQMDIPLTGMVLSILVVIVIVARSGLFSAHSLRIFREN